MIYYCNTKWDKIHITDYERHSVVILHIKLVESIPAFLIRIMRNTDHVVSEYPILYDGVDLYHSVSCSIPGLNIMTIGERDMIIDRVSKYIKQQTLC